MRIKPVTCLSNRARAWTEPVSWYQASKPSMAEDWLKRQARRGDQGLDIAAAHVAIVPFVVLGPRRTGKGENSKERLGPTFEVQARKHAHGGQPHRILKLISIGAGLAGGRSL